MSPALLCLLAVVVVPAASGPGQITDDAPRQGGAVIEHMTLTVWMDGDTLVTETGVRARALDADGLRDLRRLLISFDPAARSVRLAYARREIGGRPEEVPDWAIDTLLDGSSGNRQLAVAFPGLITGAAVEWRVETRDWSRLWGEGPWLDFDPSGMPDIELLEIEMRAPAGYEPLMRCDSTLENVSSSIHAGDPDGANLVRISAERPSGRISLSCIAGWTEAGRLILGSALTRLEESVPPDVREAVLEIASRSTGTADLARNACFAVTDNFRLVADPPLHDLFECRELQRIMDSRNATSLEMCVLLTAFLRGMGLDASPLACTEAGSLPERIVPSDWTRFVVEVYRSGREGGGRLMLLEPSAWTSPSGFVDRPDGLWAIGAMDEEPRRIPPNHPGESSCLEEYVVTPDRGTALLRVAPSGIFSTLMRTRLSDAGGEGAVAALARWFWSSGCTTVPAGVSASELRNLAEPAAVEAVLGVRPMDPPDSGFVLLPGLAWALSDDLASSFERRWIIMWQGEITVEADCGGLELSRDSGGPGWILRDTDLRRSGGVLVYLGRPRGNGSSDGSH